MQKVLILINSNPEDGPTAQLYKKHARPDQDVTVRRLDSLFANWNGHDLQVGDPRGEINLELFDVVHFAGWKPQSDMAFVVACYLRQHGIPFIGKTILDLYHKSKVGEMVKLALVGIPYPVSFYACNPSQLSELYVWANQSQGLQFPVIVKGIDASKGEDNFLVRSQEELDSLILDDNGHYIMQAAIPNKNDYRVLVIGGEAKLAIRRTRSNPDSHLNNTSQGADAELVATDKWPAGMAELAVQAAKALNQDDIAGTDILIDEENGTMYVLEVNKTPHMSLGAENIIEDKLHALFAQLDSMTK